MISSLSIKDIARVVLPRASRDGGFLMLTAYFDDSGTHQDSKVVVVAGFIAVEQAWSTLESQWRAILTRERISAFHLSECDAGQGEFSTWPRAKRDSVIHDLRQIILGLPMRGIGIAVSRLEWDELVVGDVRKSLGDADQFCVNMCMIDALNYTNAHVNEKQFAVVFDNRPNWATRLAWILEPYKRGGWSFVDAELVSVTFADMRKFIPLQAADMYACEAYRYGIDWVRTGGQPTVRPHFRGFLDSKILQGGIASRGAIERIVAFEKKAALNHLTIEKALWMTASEFWAGRSS